MTDSLFNVEELEATPSSTSDAQLASDGSTPIETATPSPQSLSLYRKYRPQSFAADELFGQQHIVNTLKNAIRLNRIGHAYLFCGPRGTGKTTTARILAKAVNCLDPDPGNRPCNACNACDAINANATTDVIEIDAASNRGIDDIRELRERVKFAPTMLQTKFYIIDEAHQITGAAANAFLKTLEEPPARTRFVLATTDPEELLQTIVSRCQRFDFRRIGLDAMTACLVMVADSERIDIDADAVTTIARHATGSLRDALGLLDQVSVYRDEEGPDTTQVTNELVRSVLGISRNDRVEGIVRAIADQDPGAGLTLVNEAVEDGEDARQLGRQFIAYLRMLMLERASGSPDVDESARELARRFELGRLAEITRIFADVDYKSRHSSVPQLPLELAIIRSCLPDQPSAQTLAPQPRASAKASVPVNPPSPTQHSNEDEPPPRRSGPSLKDRVRGAPLGQSNAEAARVGANTEAAAETDVSKASLVPDAVGSEEQASSPPVAAEPVAPTPPALGDKPGVGIADLERIHELWDTIRMDVKALNRRTEALLQQADPIRVEGSHLTLVAAYPFHQKRLNDDDTRKIIEEVIERRSGARITVSCMSRDEAQQFRSQSSATTPSPPARSMPPGSTGDKGSRQRKSSSAANPTDASDNEIAPVGSDSPTASPDYLAGFSARNNNSAVGDTSAADQDQARIDAAINIFDAEIVEDNDDQDR